jgi:hypothetical protein
MIIILIYNLIQPSDDFTKLTYPYRTPKMLYYLKSRWFIFGLVLTGVFFFIIVIEDVFSFIEKKVKERKFRKL